MNGGGMGEGISGDNPSFQPEDGPPRSQLESLSKKHDRNEREIRRLRNSVSFQLGLHLTDAVRKPWRLPLLPITFPIHAFRLGIKRIGRRSLLEQIDSHDIQKPRHCIVLFPTNGVGFGHFTRMYAVARALRKKDPTLEIVFFTPMPTLHILYNDDYATYHLAGRYKHADMSATEWNGLVEDMLHLVFETHRPKWFMFDGAYPYRGMLNAIASRQNMDKWWMRRGSIKSNKKIPVDSFSFFDGFIIPGENSISELENEHLVSPIRVLDIEEAWERAYARSRLAVPKKGKVVYVQLGAGRINNIDNIVDHVLDILFKNPEVFVVLGESMLGHRLEVQHDRLRVIRDYPNSLYANAFDASIQAGGYNSYHEMRSFGIPTLFIPNLDTGMDDQLSRCMGAEREGWGLVYTFNSESLEDKITQLFSIVPIEQNDLNGANSVPGIIGISGD